jgi:hypothetical protein
VDARAERTTLDVETGEIGSARHGEASRLKVAEADRECDRCAGLGMRQPIERLKVSDHVRKMIEVCWELGGDPTYAELNLRQWAHQMGASTHFLTKSRRYSIMFGVLRKLRRDFRMCRMLERLGLDRDTAVVRVPAGTDLEALAGQLGESAGVEVVFAVGDWRYAGRGHSPGERLWAESVAEAIAENRRIAREAVREQQWDDDIDWEAA